MKEKIDIEAELFVVDPERKLRVQLTIEMPEGRTLRVIHVLRQPTAEDRIRYYGRSTGVLPAEDGKREHVAAPNAFMAGIELWDLLVETVEGYRLPEGIDFRRTVPPEHKSWAAKMVVLSVGILSESEVKN